MPLEKVMRCELPRQGVSHQFVRITVGSCVEGEMQNKLRDIRRADWRKTKFTEKMVSQKSVPAIKVNRVVKTSWIQLQEFHEARALFLLPCNAIACVGNYFRAEVYSKRGWNTWREADAGLWEIRKIGRVGFAAGTVQRLTRTRMIRAVRLSWKRKWIGRPILPEKMGGLRRGGGFARQDLASGNPWRFLPKRSLKGFSG